MEIESKSKKPPQMERRIVLLKDFLRDDMSSCSSSGFKSFPRKNCCTYSIRNLLEIDLKSSSSVPVPYNTRKLLKNRSKSPSSSTTTTISAFQKASVAVINVVKCLSFSSSSSSVKSPLSSSPQKQGILPRSFSKKFRRSFWKKNEKVEREIKVAVRVKDIMKWKSFRDLMEDKHRSSLDSAITTTKSKASINSWSDSDFTLESLNSSSGSSNSEGSGETEEIDSNNCLPDKNKKISKRSVDDDHQEDSLIDKGECQYEKDQFSPISILDFPCEEDDESSSSSSFQSSLADMEKKNQKLMQKIRRFESLGQLDPVNLDKSFDLKDSLESSTGSSSISINATNIEEPQEQDEEFEVEEKGRKLLEVLIKETNTEDICFSTEDHLLLDFFRDEIVERRLSTKRAARIEDELDNELLSLARDWMNGNCEQLDWRFEESRKVHIRDMERGGAWRDSEEETREVSLEVEIMIMGSLVDELLIDLSS